MRHGVVHLGCRLDQVALEAPLTKRLLAQLCLPDVLPP